MNIYCQYEINLIADTNGDCEPVTRLSSKATQHFWTLYGRLILDQDLQAISDVKTRADAIEIYNRINTDKPLVINGPTIDPLELSA